MKRLACLFGVIALVPAALNPALAATTRGVIVPLCTGDGTVRMVSVPMQPRIPGDDGGAGCCAKGCHSGTSRKRTGCHI